MDNINEEGRKRVEELREKYVISDEDLKNYKNGVKLLESYKDISNTIHGEGLHYTFKGNINFDDIEDEEFHKLRKYLIQHIDLMDNYLKKRIDELS
tara:strand:- start:3221 stop:3508 length:288 start_codon:yes stop_codon:yes gene_type:complete